MTITNEEQTDIKNKFVLDLFHDDNKKDLTLLLDDIKSVPLGMSEFQINHFYLNEIEYPTEWSKFQQVKLHLFIGIQSLVDMYFHIQETNAKTELLEGEIEILKSNIESDLYSKVTNAKIKLKCITIEKNKFKIINTYHTAKEKLREILSFYNIYKNLKRFETISIEDSKFLEEELWKLRSAHNPEFKNRYGLTPNGFLNNNTNQNQRTQ